jgi:hypothetical protein
MTEQMIVTQRTIISIHGDGIGPLASRSLGRHAHDQFIGIMMIGGIVPLDASIVQVETKELLAKDKINQSNVHVLHKRWFVFIFFRRFHARVIAWIHLGHGIGLTPIGIIDIRCRFQGIPTSKGRMSGGVKGKV